MAPLALAIDIGGSQLRVALVDSAGAILRRADVATDAQASPSAAVEAISKLADSIGLNGARTAIRAAGACAPGPLDWETGTVMDIPTLPTWRGFPLRQALMEALALDVRLDNDAHAAAFGEWKFGAGAGLKTLVYVTVSTGIGGAAIIDGHLLRGRRGLAGHVGHMMVAREGPRCACGGIGCFEAIASGTAFAQAGAAEGFADAQAIVDAARRSNAAALRLVEREAAALAYGFVSLVHLYAPERLIMGGGVAQAFDLLGPLIRERVAALAMAPFRDVEIVAAKLGGNSGLIGAAALALN